MPANLLLLLVALLAAASVGETAVRCLRGDRIVLYPRFHSRAVYGDYTLRRLRPRTVFWHTSVAGHWRFATNAKGFRNDRDIPYARTPGRVRVLALGDSHTEGFEVRQDFTYSAVIERWLEVHGLPSDVINAGVSGFGTAEELAFLENEGIKYRPDAVVLGFYANDFDDNVRAGLFALRDDTLAVTSKTYAPATGILDVLDAIPPIRWLSQHSYLYSFAFNTVWDWVRAARVRRARGVPASAPATPIGSERDEYVTPIGPPTEGEVRLMRALLARMSSFCRARGILFIVIDVPIYVGRSVGAFASSIPDSLVPFMRRTADVLLLSDDVLGPYRGVAEIHVPRGARHISEFTHLMYGIRAAEAIRDRVAGTMPGARSPQRGSASASPRPGASR